MRLLHYSEKPLSFDPARRYVQDDHHKPHGLWLSVEGEDDWRSWCEGERWNVESLAHAVEIVLKPKANVLVVDTLEKLNAFNTLYGKGNIYSVRNIDWRKVVSIHDGLIIAPYQWERRLDMMWYYTWDCASGVIWNLRAISEVRPPDRSTDV